MLNNAIKFPPVDIESLLCFIDKDLIVIKNIPRTLSTDTIRIYLKSYGAIQNFALMHSSDPQRQEALLLYSDPLVAREVLAMNINGIGGFYLERCDVKKHAYLVSCYEQSQSAEPKLNPLLSPIYSDSGVITKNADDLEDLDVHSAVHTERMLPSELLVGYAQIFASGYVTLEKIAEKCGLNFIIDHFGIKKVAKDFYDYLHLESCWNDIQRVSQFVKEQIRKRNVGKPLVDHYEEIKYCVFETVDHTKRIIAAKRMEIQSEELFDTKYKNSL